jgi:hypothetical protein
LKAEPKRVSRSVLEVEPAELVPDEYVAGPEVGVTLLENVGQDFLLGCFGVTISLLIKVFLKELVY